MAGLNKKKFIMKVNSKSQNLHINKFCTSQEIQLRERLYFYF